MTTTTTAAPTVSPVGRTRVRIEAESADYRLDLWNAQEFASRLALALEQTEATYNPPSHTTRKRTLEISPHRTIRVTGGRRSPEIRLRHASVILLSTAQAHELVAVIVSEIEATEERFESKRVDPYA